MNSSPVHLPPTRCNEIPSEHMEEATLGKLVFIIDATVLDNIIFHGSDMVLQRICLSRIWGKEIKEIKSNENVANLRYIEAFPIFIGNKIEVRCALGDCHMIRHLETLAGVYICDGGDAAVPEFHVLKQ
jgi:hypothetical protein